VKSPRTITGTRKFKTIRENDLLPPYKVVKRGEDLIVSTVIFDVMEELLKRKGE